jgi:hypothetical protein
MIIESIHTNDITRLNDLSPDILYDLERVHIAAEHYGFTDSRLSDSIEKYLMYLINHQNFGEIFQIAKSIYRQLQCGEGDS